MSKDGVPKGLKKAGQKFVDSFFGGEVAETLGELREAITKEAKEAVPDGMEWKPIRWAPVRQIPVQRHAKELPVKCPRCENFTFASFSACHVCDNPVAGKGKAKFKYKKVAKGY